MLALACLPDARAVTPVTPQLAPESRSALDARLAAVAFPEVARNSVFIALGEALGMEPRATTHRYDVRRAHLPVVEVKVTPATARCADVVAVAAFAARPAFGRTTVRGRYCLTGLGVWSAEAQEVSRAGS